MVSFDRSGDACQVVSGEHAYRAVVVVDNDGDASASTQLPGDLGQQRLPSGKQRLLTPATNDVAQPRFRSSPDRDPFQIAQRESTGRVPGEVHQREGSRNRLVVP